MRYSKSFVMILVLVLMGACTRQAHTAPYINFSNVGSDQNLTATIDPYLPATRMPDQPILTPTPSAPQPLPTLRTEDIYYTVQWGDSLRSIANRYNLLTQQIIDANQISNPSLIYTGQQLLLPAPEIADISPDFKIIPDSELVRGPYTVRFQIESFIMNQPGYLKDYQVEVEGEELSSAQIVSRVSQDYSVNPRLLLAIIEYQIGWLSSGNDKDNPYPLGFNEFGYEDLFYQLEWAANELNRGYYLWRVKGIATWTLIDGVNVPINPTINAGTAGVQHFFAQTLPLNQWAQTISEDGFVNTYINLFGYPFDYTYMPLVPENLTQPRLQLPFEDDVVWSYSGGPHGGWDTGSAWAALDFAPSEEELGCQPSNDWVVAVADGHITRSDHGAVVQSIDGDPYDQTGWSILYLHIDEVDRVDSGIWLKAGERIGHPSCEGGISTGTHLHIARRYNGEWIPADQDVPFNLDGWISQGLGAKYEGLLVRGDQTIRAEDTKTDFNRIER